MSKIAGSRKVQRFLRKLPPEATETLRKELMLYAKTVETQMKRDVPKKTGNLEKRIKARKLRRGFLWRVGFPNTRASRKRWFYARIIEKGRVGSTIENRFNRNLWNPSTGDQFGRQGVKIPRKPAQPFVFTAIPRTINQFTSRLQRVYDKTIIDAVRKSGR